MDKYKILKENKLNLEIGEAYDEAEVDSLCSMDFDTYDGQCWGSDCIDCLVIHHIVTLGKRG